MAQAFSALIALVTAFVAAPLIAWATKGRYYLARADHPQSPARLGVPADAHRPWRRVAAELPDEAGAYGLARCCICERDYERDDMAHCPAYRGPICSLCCTLDARCDDLCKPDARLVGAVARAAALAAARARVAVARHRARPLPAADAVRRARPRPPCCGCLAGRASSRPTRCCCWCPASSHGGWCWRTRAAQVAQEESNRQTHALNEQTQALRREIESHRRTDEQLQQARSSRARAALRRPRQPGEEPLHHRHQPRAAHAAQQHPRLRAAAGGGRRGASRSTGRPCA